GHPLFALPSLAEKPEAALDATAYMKYMGTLEPDFSGGLSTSFRYKTLTLSASFNLNVGGKRFLYSMFDEDMVNSVPSAYSNLPQELTKRWRKPGDQSDIPGLPSVTVPGIAVPGGGTEYPHRLYNYSDIRLVNASFFRCNNISLMYTLPAKWVESAYLKNVAVSASVSNPFKVVSKGYKGLDPEVATGSQPLSHTYSFSLNVTF
ncbi:MAG: SusC/RagA family TonB-linked outer membrane protein, partial [Odoribacter sp.]|nr:SusC/RagA family TonB-linked outer membrane protein [Odoribacter sp.]